jgi:hypothetical protein
LTSEARVKTLDTDRLIQAFAPLAEWTYRSREQDRSVLSTLVPEIRVADYKIESLGLNPLTFGNEDSRMGKGNFIAEPPLLYLPMTPL